MDDARLMRGLEPVRDLDHEIQDPGDCERAIADQAGEVDPRHVLDRQVENAVRVRARTARPQEVRRFEPRLAEIEARGDRRVAERGLGAGLAQEARAVLGVAGELLGQDLERHHAIEAGVARLEHDAHPTATDGFQQLVICNAAQ